jgi:hypothetical protein
MPDKDEFDFFEIDLHRLDEEWVRQPRLYFRYASKLADARRDHEQAKTDKDVAYSEVDRDIRSCPEKYDLVKLTEPGIERAVILSVAYQRANKAVIDAKHKVDILQAAVDTLDHRKAGLENAVRLHLANYYSTPKKPEEGREQLGRAERDAVFGKKAKRIKTN